MSLLKNYSDLQAVVNAITALNDETDTFKTAVYNGLIALHGNKTASSFIDNGYTADDLANIINNMFSGLWSKVKEMTTGDNSIDTYTTQEKTDKLVYGYNSENGVNDNTTIKTITKGYYDLYTMYQKTVAFFNNNSYYCIVVCCIAKVLTLPIYESED